MADFSLDMLDHYEVQDQRLVEMFITAHPSLRDVLTASYLYIEQTFGADTSVHLGLDNDENAPRLIVTIQTIMPPREAVSKLNEIVRWRIKNHKAVTGLLSFDIGYR